MATKAQRKAAAKKGAQGRKRSILRAEGWSDAEIDARRLDRRSFESKDVVALRAQKAERLAEGLQVHQNVRDPQERFQVAAEYARRYNDARFRQERIRERRLLREGFTQEEIDIKHLETFRFSNKASAKFRKMRRQAIIRQIASQLPRGLKSRARAYYNEKGRRFEYARDVVSERDRRTLHAQNKDYPMRLLDLVSP